MADFSPLSLWRKFLALPNDNLSKTLVFALILALVASAVVSTTAITLRPYYRANLDRERQEQLAGIMESLPDIAGLLAEAGVDKLEVRIVDLATGEFEPTLDPDTFDQRKAARDPDQSTQLPKEIDVAGIAQRANYAPVFLLRRDRALKLVVLPVRGVGYQSMLYAYLALQADGNTISGLTVYEQGETPGFGARVLEPDWQALWPDKRIFDDTGALRISVVRGEATGPYEVDGITGATRTSNGVSNMLTFWLGDHGFGPFLARLRAGGV
jgi:Na+-transporting NADH:ubiquinone oxidoreductase subunit C